MLEKFWRLRVEEKQRFVGQSDAQESLDLREVGFFSLQRDDVGNRVPLPEIDKFVFVGLSAELQELLNEVPVANRYHIQFLLGA